MKLNITRMMRQQIQEKIDSMNVSGLESIQKQGWIKMIRKSLGLSIKDLAQKLNCQPSNIILLEKNEIASKIKIETLEKAAEAMNCRLVYAFVPQDGSLETIIQQKSLHIAEKLTKDNDHTMQLEEQGISVKQIQQQKADAYKAIANDPAIKIWGIKK